MVLASTKSYSVSLWGECGGTGYNASTVFKHKTYDNANKGKQHNVRGGYFLKASGKKVQIKGSFRNFGSYVDNYGIPYALNYEKGNIFEFYVQKLTVDSSSSASNVLGLDITFVLYPDDVLAGLSFNSETYFKLIRHL